MTNRIHNIDSDERNRGVAQDSAMTDLADSLRVAFEKNGTPIEMATQLQALSSATGERMSKLYEFQRGLEAVGEKRADLPGIFMHAQKALSGADEKGSQAAAAFSSLGLTPDSLHGKDMADVVLRIAYALHNLKTDQAAEMAKQLFGQDGANSVLQIGREMDLFQGEMSNAFKTGELLEKFSHTFQEMNASRNDLRGDLLGIQAAVIGKEANDLQKIFAIIHDDIKNVGTAIADAGPSPADIINGALKKLKTDLAPFTAIAPKSPGDNAGHADGNANATNAGLDAEKLRHRPEFTSLEKMGFIMSGGKVQNPYDIRKVDLLQQIANNTARDHSTPTPAHAANAL